MNKSEVKELMFTRVKGMRHSTIHLGELTGYDPVGGQFMVNGNWCSSIEPWAEVKQFIEKWKGKKIRLCSWEKGYYVTPTGLFDGEFFETVDSSGLNDLHSFDCEWKEFQEPKKRLITAVELAEKWLELDGVFTRVNRIITRDNTVKLTHDWHKVEELHEDEYQWCYHPSEELKSLEVNV